MNKGKGSFLTCGNEFYKKHDSYLSNIGRSNYKYDVKHENNIDKVITDLIGFKSHIKNINMNMNDHNNNIHSNNK